MGRSAYDPGGHRRRLDSAVGALLPLVHGLTILVADDDDFVRDSTRLLLEDLGARVLTATNGAKALNRLEAETPDLILSDLSMPELDGYHLVERLRNDARRQTLPVIAVSSSTGPADREHTRRAGFDAHVGKPFDYGDLYEALATIMRRQPHLYARQRKHLRGLAEQERQKALELRQQSKLVGGTSPARFAPRVSCRCGAPSVETLRPCADCAGRCCSECAFHADGHYYCLPCADRRLAA
jgi:CheY-like chemotaxis protein